MAAGQPSTREALYERIRTSSKDEVILEEMVRLGFWPASGTVPGDPADEIRRRGELQRQLDDLREKGRRLYNEKALIAEGLESPHRTQPLGDEDAARVFVEELCLSTDFTLRACARRVGRDAAGVKSDLGHVRLPG